MCFTETESERYSRARLLSWMLLIPKLCEHVHMEVETIAYGACNARTLHRTRPHLEL